MDGTKNIALFLDGTWNTVDDNTNVWRLSALCSAVHGDGTPQAIYYDQGVGTKWGEHLRGGILGYGLDRGVLAAYRWLIKTYNPGDKVYVFGFSRGAYTARSLTGLIAKCGLLQPGAPLSIDQIFSRYRESKSQRAIYQLEFEKRELDRRARGKSKTTREIDEFSREESWLLAYSQRIKIQFIGVFDTVGSLGIPFGHIPGLSRSSFLFHHTRLSNLFQFAYQALAIDEHRKDFAPSLWTRFTPSQLDKSVRTQPKAEPVVEQRWFCGAHANVGGGYINDRLAQIPLSWLVGKATMAGLAFRYPVIVDKDSAFDPVADSYSEMAYGLYKVVTLGRRHYRTIGLPPFPVSDPPGMVSTVNETIDSSVFDRWRAQESYRPPAVIDWTERTGINPVDVRSAVLADAGKPI
ncbi:DUF2235 domain-containing protein [Rhizobium leguminosarum]|nr:DUF2235 domain-containing protein [Rhizobium leguminosarum]MBY5856392.1 DUF2235 domain-containing protein [Rhizobium leguminosarum]